MSSNYLEPFCKQDFPLTFNATTQSNILTSSTNGLKSLKKVGSLRKRESLSNEAENVKGRQNGNFLFAM